MKFTIFLLGIMTVFLQTVWVDALRCYWGYPQMGQGFKMKKRKEAACEENLKFCVRFWGAAPGDNLKTLILGCDDGGFCSENGRHRGSIKLPAYDKGKDSALDVTVVSLPQSALVDRCATDYSAALEHAHNRKMASAFQACADVGVSFFPLAVETFGGWHPKALGGRLLPLKASP